ncbi:MAG: hypothetical protein NZ555_03435 [Geminicoccaceae bacterium]|nr:hypothetical protein [Geminicoccaceae bacterium]MCX8100511.1 hypothetical protein [Geminicoccaceae bacterium]MDW8371334.1 hypothetical protein [Geminicoccaceae bacterium]
MARSTQALELDQPAGWQPQQDAAWTSEAAQEEERWPLYKTALFVIASSAALWGGIFALIGWLF